MSSITPGRMYEPGRVYEAEIAHRKGNRRRCNQYYRRSSPSACGNRSYLVESIEHHHRNSVNKALRGEEMQMKADTHLTGVFGDPDRKAESIVETLDILDEVVSLHIVVVKTNKIPLRILRKPSKKLKERMDSQCTVDTGS
jgi:hypothetical protein